MNTTNTMTKKQYKNALRALLNTNTCVIFAPKGFRHSYMIPEGRTAAQRLEESARRHWAARRRVVDQLAAFFAAIEDPNAPGYIYSWAIGSGYYKHGLTLARLAEMHGVQFADTSERDAFEDLGGALFEAAEYLYNEEGVTLCVCPYDA